MDFKATKGCVLIFLQSNLELDQFEDIAYTYIYSEFSTHYCVSASLTSAPSHHTHINEAGPQGVRVSVMERSSDQVIQPVNIKALSKWVGSFPDHILDDMEVIAPMLRKLGYDPTKNPPNYGRPATDIINNTNQVLENEDYWAERKERIFKEIKKPTLNPLL